MSEDYYDSIIFMFHCILLIESVFCAIIFIKNITFSKAPKGKNYLFIINLAQCALTIYCLFYAFLEYQFLSKYFFIDSRFYFYELYAMSMQIIFMAIFTINYLRKES